MSKVCPIDPWMDLSRMANSERLVFSADSAYGIALPGS
jgi:hypothetical protein